MANNIPLKKLIVVILLNSLIVASEIVFGLFGNSMALISDALHNLGDILALGVSFIAIIYSTKKATRSMTYGYVRSEMMAGLINSFFLILTMLFVIYESSKKLFSQQEVNGLSMIIVAGIAFIANGFSAYLLGTMHLHHHDHNHEDHAGENVCNEETNQTKDKNIQSAYLHLLSDAGISLGVVLGGLLIMLLRINFIDSIIAILFSLYVLFESYKILRSTFFSLMDMASNNLDDIEKTIMSHPEIKSMHDIHLTSPSSKDTYFSAHLVFHKDDQLGNIENLIEQIRMELKSFGITHVILQPETGKYHNSDTLCCSHCE